ncbi:aminopeptidase N [Duganella sp. CF402]|uniref:M1 family metallopeptidase n=1 Tax=unclassified Duganella TaxID=2636909 RepID=UPI0008C9D511|nr:MULTISPECIES: M1 family metallopeptidase [unclassified Duganella]RZT09955.1 aminopeptidase N [Duganella sp. BK701]SEL35432.1 aminopeptidase N [Duganella sp. CF402]
MQRTLISLAVAAALGLALPLAASAAEKAAQVTTQLPRNAAPTHYALSLTPDAANSSFSASVTIALNVKQATSSLTLNAIDLKFSAAAISAGPGKPAQAASKIEVNDKAQTATFHFAEALKPGSYQLKLDYTGKIGDQPAGLFSLDYENDGARKRALYTQFEATDARRMIPSWDEPSYKATFALEATIPAGQMAVSNMPVASTTRLADGRELVRFATSPKMSTYLLFFGLGEFDRATAVEAGVELGVVTQKGHVAQAQFALDSSRAVLKEYNDYFGVKFPLPKLDNVAAPGRSQSFGAMENWGAIFTFEYAMLLDPRTATQADKETSFLVAAHEIAHQWFGDLVTMSWWDDLWLNEGFASWMESRTTDLLHPEWNWKLRGVGSRDSAMERDALATTHPVVQRIRSADEISQAFDAITYNKGAAVINMLENYVGADAWRAGVRSYMAKHAYGNTVSSDLWGAVEKAAHKPVVAIAHDFTLQPGVPLVSVADAVCKNGKTTVQLTQGEFSKDQENKKPLSWRVPVIAQTVGNATVRTVINGGKATLTLPGCGAVLVNAGQSGYYRTLYAPKAFAALADNFAKLPAIDQLGLLGDSWSLGLAGRMPASGFLELAARTPVDAAPEVWQRIANTLAGLRDNYDGKPEQRAVLDRFTHARLAPVLARVGWNAAKDEAATVANLRETLIAALGKSGDEAVLAEARRLYAASQTDKNALPAALRRPVLAVIAANADQATWNQLRAAAKAESSASIKDELYDLLGAARDPALAQRALDLAMTDEPGATTGASIISEVAVRHPDLAFDFAMTNLAQVEQKMEAWSRSRYFPRLGSFSANPAMIGKLQAYAGQHLAADATGDTKTAIAAVEYRIKVRSKRLPQIDAWLAQHAG